MSAGLARALAAGGGAMRAAAGERRRALVFIMRALALLILAARAHALVNITVNTSVIVNRVPPTYISFNLDWHLDAEEWPAWRACSVLNMSLDEPNLNFLAKAMAPAILRVGGSQGDLVFYETPGMPCPFNTTFCLTMDRWAEITAFAARNDLTLAFGLNAMAGRLNKTCPKCPWDSANTDAFLSYTAAHKLPVSLFEFGNELTPFVNVDTYSADVLVLRSLIDKYWPDAATRPRLVANDANPDPKCKLTRPTTRLYATLKTESKSPSLRDCILTPNRSRDGAEPDAGRDRRRHVAHVRWLRARPVPRE